MRFVELFTYQFCCVSNFIKVCISPFTLFFVEGEGGLDLELKYEAIFQKKDENKNVPHLPLLSTENKKDNEIKRIPHWVFDLFTLL